MTLSKFKSIFVWGDYFSSVHYLATLITIMMESQPLLCPFLNIYVHMNLLFFVYIYMYLCVYIYILII